jgi:hypothetical protein
MAIQKYQGAPWLYDDTTGDIIGVKDPDGSEFYWSRASNYGLFYDLADQSASINTANPIRFNTPVIEQGVRMVDTNKITFDRGGKFSFTLTAQIENGDSKANNFWLWGRINGVDIPNSLTRYSVPSSHGGLHGALVVERSYFGPMDAGQHIQVMWMTDNALVTFNYAASSTSPAMPATPSAYLSVHEVAA